MPPKAHPLGPHRGIWKGGKAGYLFYSGPYQAWLFIQVASWPGAWPGCLFIYSPQASRRRRRAGRWVLNSQNLPNPEFVRCRSLSVVVGRCRSLSVAVGRCRSRSVAVGQSVGRSVGQSVGGRSAVGRRSVGGRSVVGRRSVGGRSAVGRHVRHVGRCRSLSVAVGRCRSRSVVVGRCRSVSVGVGQLYCPSVKNNPGALRKAKGQGWMWPP